MNQAERGRLLTYLGPSVRVDMHGEIDGDKGARYQLVVRGELDARYAYLFEPLQLEHTAGSTVMEGTVLDQAQLHGFIERIEELGLELMSVERTDPNAE